MVLSSGLLPLSSSYHVAALLGEGSFASVRRVFDDDGNEFALKVFDADEEEGGTIDIATLREISVLQLLVAMLTAIRLFCSSTM